VLCQQVILLKIKYLGRENGNGYAGIRKCELAVKRKIEGLRRVAEMGWRPWISATKAAASISAALNARRGAQMQC
jgi:hypothetical protein